MEWQSSIDATSDATGVDATPNAISIYLYKMSNQFNATSDAIEVDALMQHQMLYR